MVPNISLIFDDSWIDAKSVTLYEVEGIKVYISDLTEIESDGPITITTEGLFFMQNLVVTGIEMKKI